MSRHSLFFTKQSFFAEADAMRAAFDRHFENPSVVTAEHMIWAYWHIPQLYTYLRTLAHHLFPEALLVRFMRRLQRWSIDELGLPVISTPWLGLYIDGFGQSLHNDARKYRWAYVYSLTHWKDRPFSGGETLLADRLMNHGRSPRMFQPGAHFLTRLSSPFNQLLIFDNRIPHGVEPLCGNFAPQAGRVVLHGHIGEAGTIAVGALNRETVDAILDQHVPKLRARVAPYADQVAGLLPIRLDVDPSGSVSHARALRHTLYSIAVGGPPHPALIRETIRLMRALRFPRRQRPSQITFPLVFPPG